LGGNRAGKAKRYRNLFLTMLLGGLWHGAGWTFVAWGALHGLYLIANHAWQKFCRVAGFSAAVAPKAAKFLSWLLTFLAVVIGWVFFRASDFDSAIAILKGMIGLNGVAIPNGVLARLGGAGTWLLDIGVSAGLGGGAVLALTYLWVFALLFVALLMPNTQQFMSRASPAISEYQSDAGSSIALGDRFMSPLKWRPAVIWSVGIGVIAALGVLALTSVSEFLYFQF
jgi:alginate O-acetyltransferase complex protein AlgI